MDLVEDLAFGIVQEYRENQKNRLQRTFVSGSAAASGKVNRGRPKWPYSFIIWLNEMKMKLKWNKFFAFSVAKA